MMDRDTKLIAIWRRQYHIILTMLGENIFRIGLRRFATPPNTEYIFSQLAVNIYVVLPSQNRDLFILSSATLTNFAPFS